MSPEQFRAVGHRLIDWIADYHQSLEHRPPSPQVKPGDLLDALPAHPPRDPGDADEWDRIIADLDQLITPGLLHWQSPKFFGYFPCNCSMPGVLGALVSAGLNVNGMLWATSPAATELEMRLLDWMAESIGLPDRFTFRSPTGGGCIQGTASEAALVALLAARQRERRRMGDNPLGESCLITSDQAHSSVTKAAMVAGIADGPDDRRHVRLVHTHSDGRMDLDDLRRTVDHIYRSTYHPERAEPWPIMISATVGTTGSGGIDDIAGIRALMDEFHLEHTRSVWPGWLHVDAAWAGSAAICPEHRGILAGVENADSICFNPHKWLLTNFDCDLMWTRDRTSLTAALSITPEYLRNPSTESGQVIDYRDWQIPLGRSFRSLKLWFVLRHYGIEGLRAHIRAHVAAARWLEERLRGDPRFELVGPRVLALVCFRLRTGDQATKRLLDQVNGSGKAFISHTRLPGEQGREQLVLRVAIGAPATQERHVHELWSLIDEAAGEAGES